MRQADGHSRSAQRFQHADRLPHAALDLGLHTGDEILLRDTHPQAGEIAGAGQVQLRHREIEAGGIARVCASHGLEDERHIGGIPSESPHDVQRGAESHQTVARDAPVGGL